MLCVVGSAVEAREVARAVAQELASLESTLPPGPKTAEELAEQRPQRDSAAYAFELFDAGSGWVTLGDRVVLPPATRCLHVTATHDAADALRPFAAHLTNIAANTAELARSFRSSFGGARVVALGEMQRPPLDGPVDLRDGSAGYLL